jgi:adenylylsulfate kinase
MIIQLTGLSGVGKTTLATRAKEELEKQDIQTEILDGDIYRQHLFKELGYSDDDRCENLRRLAFLANRFSDHKTIAIICAINPFEKIRKEIKDNYKNVKTVFIDCQIEELIRRDTKGLYKKAFLPDSDKDKLHNLTGINARFDIPADPDLVINTLENSIEICVAVLTEFIKKHSSRLIRDN